MRGSAAALSGVEPLSIDLSPCFPMRRGSLSESSCSGVAFGIALQLLCSAPSMTAKRRRIGCWISQETSDAFAAHVRRADFSHSHCM